MTPEQAPVYVSLEFTPNPNTLKYSVNRELLPSGALNFPKNDDSVKERSPLAAKIFETPGISGVMFGKDFVTVTKSEDGDWDVVHKNSSKIIEEHLTAGEPVYIGDLPAGAGGEAQTEAEKKIREIIDNEIRPAVAMDGGDIAFEKFEEGTVFLHLQGSCAGCPSATMTLKMGIETRLKDAVPEVQEVVSVLKCRTRIICCDYLH